MPKKKRKGGSVRGWKKRKPYGKPYHHWENDKGTVVYVKDEKTFIRDKKPPRTTGRRGIFRITGWKVIKYNRHKTWWAKGKTVGGKTFRTQEAARKYAVAHMRKRKSPKKRRKKR